MNLKYQIAKKIGYSYVIKEDCEYEDLLNAIYDNYYRTIQKVPINIFILGIVNSFIIKDLNHANKILTAVKEVVVESLEMSGFELTFTDSDWNDLVLIEDFSQYRNKANPYLLSKNDEKEGKSQGKNYMSEYFEL